MKISFVQIVSEEDILKPKVYNRSKKPKAKHLEVVCSDTIRCLLQTEYIHSSKQQVRHFQHRLDNSSELKTFGTDNSGGL